VRSTSRAIVVADNFNVRQMKIFLGSLSVVMACLVGCVANYYYNVTLSAPVSKPFPKAEAVLHALRDDPEVVRVEYERYAPPKEGGAPLDRLLIFSHTTIDNFFVYGSSRNFQLGLSNEDGKTSIFLFHQYWTQVKGAQDQELTGFMKRVYGRLQNSIGDLPPVDDLRFKIERGSAH
jgi:hypothetical protein